ncbi:hypothetical protein DFS34DRAFT_593148 [Phlyctochytrium arcticum]|nr:hypothetical protein DFS34DRAFT_593148 [Phlyctochytrium arcticum]
MAVRLYAPRTRIPTRRSLRHILVPVLIIAAILSIPYLISNNFPDARDFDPTLLSAHQEDLEGGIGSAKGVAGRRTGKVSKSRFKLWSTNPNGYLTKFLDPPYWNATTHAVNSNRVDMTDPHLCVLARTYPKQYSYVPAFLSSLVHMGMDLSIHLLVTDGEGDTRPLERIVARVNEDVELLSRTFPPGGDVAAGEGVANPRRDPASSWYVDDSGRMVLQDPDGKTDEVPKKDPVSILPITRADAQRVYTPPPGESDYGYGFTDAALDYMLRGDSPMQCDYLLITNADNLYAQAFHRRVLPLLRGGIDMVIFDFLSAHVWPHRTQPHTETNGVHDDGTMKHMTASYKVSEVDLGAAVFRMDLLREHPEIRFVKVAKRGKGQDGTLGLPKLWTADGEFILRVASLTPFKAILRQTLFVHQ